MIKIQNLSFAYQKDLILEEINISIIEKDFLAIIGPNGGGKSTLLKLLLSILKTDKGSIEIDDKIQNSIGYVPQNTDVNINFPINTQEVVMMGIKERRKRTIFGYNKEEKTLASNILNKVNMEAFAKNKIGSLSGGQRQRVMIARALISNPKILILDEPTSNIDKQGQKDIYNLLKELNKEITIIVVSHDISVTLEYANKVAYLNKTLSYHDISDKTTRFHLHENNEHFCEIELLEMLSEENCQECEKEQEDEKEKIC